MKAPPYHDRDAVFEAFGRRVSRGKVQAYREFGLDVVMGHREGVWFEDAYGKRRFLNCHCNGGVFNLGHKNPRVIDAVRQALLELDVGNHHLVSGYRAELAERLAATTAGALSGVVFGVSGGEAMDLAIKLCRGATGRGKIVSALGGYHGHTGLALAAGDAQYREPFAATLPDFVQVPFDDVGAMQAAVDSSTAAVVLEPIPATLGMPIASPGYFEAVQAACRAHGAKLIVDEVQTGLGRTGKLWAYQHHDVTPDLLVTGKGLSGGVYPITATLMSEELFGFFDERPFVHISTFGGAEPGCVAAMEVLDILQEPGFLARVEELGARFEQELGSGMPFSLRRQGLMMGFKFPVDGAGMAAAKALYDVEVFAAYANNDRSVLQFLPPLVLTDDEAGELIARVRKAFGG